MTKAAPLTNERNGMAEVTTVDGMFLTVAALSVLVALFMVVLREKRDRKRRTARAYRGK